MVPLMTMTAQRRWSSVGRKGLSHWLQLHPSDLRVRDGEVHNADQPTADLAQTEELQSDPASEPNRGYSPPDLHEGDARLHWSLQENPDAAWISEGPTSDSVSPGVWSDVAVRFNTTGLAPGTYHTNLVVTNDDPDKPKLKVSVEIIVRSGIGISEEPASRLNP